MTTLAELEMTAQNFITELHRFTEGKTDAQASMYTIGETIGLEREDSAAVAEELMAFGLVEVRTLAGAIGLSDQGAALMGESNGGDGRRPQRLGMASPMNTVQGELVEKTLTTIKAELGQSGLAFDPLSEMVADIRTIEAQMISPKPKTIIIRECFTSLLASARENRQEHWRTIVEELLG